MLQLFVQLFVAYRTNYLRVQTRARKKMDDRAFFCKISISRDVTNKKNGKKNGEKGFRKKEARRREKYVENWYYPTYYQAYVKMSNGDPHRMKPSPFANGLQAHGLIYSANYESW